MGPCRPGSRHCTSEGSQHGWRRGSSDQPEADCHRGRWHQQVWLLHAPSHFCRCPSDGGRTIQIKRKGITYTADNSMVVPYNPLILLRYKCHINVEKCASNLGAKYIYKY